MQKRCILYFKNFGNILAFGYCHIHNKTPIKFKKYYHKSSNRPRAGRLLNFRPFGQEGLEGERIRGGGGGGALIQNSLTLHYVYGV